jgi:AraC-like DNA-binding protein
VSLVVRPRAPELVPFVRSLGYFCGELPPARERVLPSGETSLLVNLYEDELRTYEGPDSRLVRRTHGAALLGPRGTHQVIDTEEQRCVIEVDFEFGGAWHFFAVPSSEARDELVELDQLWGRDGFVLRERLLEAATPAERLRIVEAVLLEHVARPLAPDPATAFAVAALERGLAVADVTSRLGLLPKTFLRRFRERVGLAPKEFSRVRRLQRVLRSVGRNGETSWAEVAAEQGYYDQSHLIHDFRELTGITPTAYRPRSASERNHVPVPPIA